MKLINIYNNRRKIFLFCRDNEGKQIIEEDNSFFPYFYEVDTEGKFKSYDGKPLKKIFVSEPSDVPKRRSDQAYEADILFTKRYMIDKINKLTKCPIKYAFIDIEILADELPNVERANHTISCISVYNSMYESIQTWYLEDYRDELGMLKEFITYMRKESFDLWLSWNVKFDYNYLNNRIEGMRYDFNKKSLAELISPIGKSRYGDGEIFYPAGISIVDYLTWFKKITLNRRKSYALDSIAQVDLGEQANEKIEFGKLNPKIKEKNIHDIERMVKLEEKFKLVDYYDEIRRLSKVEWEDMIWSSRIIDMLLLEEAKNQKIALPMKPAEERGTLTEKEQYEGAYRDIFKTGAFIKSVGKYDLSSAYPSMIVDFALDPSNIVDLEPFLLNGHVTLQTANKAPKVAININKVDFMQNLEAILPTVVKKLITLKTEIKQKLTTSKETKQKYDAIKSIVNSSYGVFGNRFFRLYCYSEDTEILTEDGWKYWFDIKKGINVATMNTNIDKIEFQPILNINIQKVKNQEMYHFQNKRTDQLITPHHKVLYFDKKGNKYISYAKDAKIFHREFPLVRELIDNRLDYPISDELLKLHAWIITEGTDEYKSNNMLSFKNLKNKSRWRIVQSLKVNKKYCEEIDLIFKKLKWNIYSNITGFIKRWDIYSKYSEYIKLEKNYKIIPLWMLQKLSLRQLKLLYETLMKGDGTKTGYVYSIKDKKGQDRFQHLCTLLGISSIKKKNLILLNKSQNVTISSSRYKKEKLNYSGIVWCPTVTNGFVVVRRKGKVFISGNSKKVASATTYLVRDVLHYVQNKLEEEGYKVIYVDTDGILIDNNIDDISSKLNNLVKQWAKEKYNKVQLTTEFSYEGYYEKLLLLAKCRYYGELRTEKGKLKEETCGIEAKRKDSTVYMKKFQKELINKILNKETKENIINWIKEEIKNLPNQPLREVSFPCKLARDPRNYLNTPIFLRALNNTPNFKKKVGDNFYYIFVKSDGEQDITTNIYIDNQLVESVNKNLSRKEGITYISQEQKGIYPKGIEIDTKRIKVLHKKSKPKDVMAFDEDNNKHITKNMVDWDKIIKRNIIMKLDTIFIAMGWDLEEIGLKGVRRGE